MGLTTNSHHGSVYYDLTSIRAASSGPVKDAKSSAPGLRFPAEVMAGKSPPIYVGLGQFWENHGSEWAKFPAMRKPEAITGDQSYSYFVRFHQHFTLLHHEFSACDAQGLPK